MNKKFNLVNLFLIMIIILCLLLIFFGQLRLSGHVVEKDVISNVSISKSLAISFSPDLSSGIQFEDVIILPADNINAVENYNKTNNNTGYYVEVSSDGNVAVDLCIKANAGLTSLGGDIIDLDKETFAYSSVNNLTLPALGNEIPLTLGYSDMGNDIPIGSRNYLRFWLDVPAGQASGQYNNSIYINAVPFDVGCN